MWSSSFVAACDHSLRFTVDQFRVIHGIDRNLGINLTATAPVMHDVYRLRLHLAVLKAVEQRQCRKILEGVFL